MTWSTKKTISNLGTFKFIIMTSNNNNSGGAELKFNSQLLFQDEILFSRKQKVANFGFSLLSFNTLLRGYKHWYTLKENKSASFILTFFVTRITKKKSTFPNIVAAGLSRCKVKYLYRCFEFFSNLVITVFQIQFQTNALLFEFC